AGAVPLLQTQRRPVHAALAAHILPKYHHAGVAGELDVQRPANGRLHVDSRSFRCGSRARRWVSIAIRRKSTLLLKILATVRALFPKYVARHIPRIGMRP